MIKVGCNRENPILEVEHAKLERAIDHSVFRSICPVCKEGILLVRRNQMTMTLIPEDCCVLCEQKYAYTDIEELRKVDPFSLRK